MEHNEATETMAAERYLLGEMTTEDREAFEEHFFGCSACAADVRDGARVGATIRSDAANRTRQPTRFGAARWLIASAPAVVVAGMLLVQNLALQRQIAAARQPRVVPSVSLIDFASRGFEKPLEEGHLPFVVDFDLAPITPPRPQFVDVVDARGKVVVPAVKISAEAANNTLHLFFPDGSLPPGRYELKVRAVPNGSSDTAGSFVVR